MFPNAQIHNYKHEAPASGLEPTQIHSLALRACIDMQQERKNGRASCPSAFFVANHGREISVELTPN
jgi:hypothetical protein